MKNDPEGASRVLIEYICRDLVDQARRGLTHQVKATKIVHHGKNRPQTLFNGEVGHIEQEAIIGFELSELVRVWCVDCLVHLLKELSFESLEATFTQLGHVVLAPESDHRAYEAEWGWSFEMV